MSTTKPLKQFPYMKYLDNCLPWALKPIRRKPNPYVVPCRYKRCHNKVLPTTIGAKSGICDDCFRYKLGGAFHRFKY